ncbi:MAG: SpoIIE family protein phosphatase, partial [Flammeovirgaceae bacterium]
KSLYEFLDPNLIDFLTQSEVPFHEVDIKSLTGKTISTEWTSRKVSYADRLVYVLSVRDISKRKQAEKQVAAQAEQLEEARQIIELNKEIEKQNTKINASIFYAKKIQNAMLPRDEVFSKYLPQSFVFFKPRDVVSGDFYWITQKQTAGGYPLVIVAAIDCTGHGVPGAFMSMTGDALLNSIINTSQITQPDQILSHLHKGIRRTFKQADTKNSDGMDMSLCVLNYETNELSFAGANSPLIFIQENALGQFETNYIKGDKKSIGGKVFPNETRRVFTTHTFSFDKSMTCYIFSDGYQDQFGGPQGRKFMGRRLRKLLTEIHQKPFSAQHQLIEQKLDSWMGAEKQIDDILLIGFKAEPKP